MNGLRAERQAIAAVTADKKVRQRILIACCLVSAAKLLQPPIWVFDPPRELPFDAAWSNYWLFSSLAGLATVSFYLAGGALGDLYGRRRLMLIGLSGYAASNLLVMATPTPVTYFEVEREISTVVAIFWLAPILVGSIAALYLFVRSVRKHQARLVIAAGLAAMAAAIALTALLPLGAPYLLYAVPLFVFGFGYLVAVTVWLSAFLRTAVDGYYGLNAGINKAAALVGGALGAAVTGKVLAMIGNAYYSNKLSQTGLSAGESAAALAAFNSLLTASSTNVQAVIQQAQQELAAGYLEVYAVAYDRVLWLMAGLCALCAIVILLGLRRSLRAEQAGQQAQIEPTS
jgi:MFS family permease